MIIYIITSIFEPTEAVKSFSKINDCSVIIVGDKKSPNNYICDNVQFLSCNVDNNFSIEKVLPFNHYCRKMIGYIKAVKEDTKFIIDTDDDNLPLNNWKLPDFEGYFQTIEKNSGFVNIYNLYSSQKIWPRGFPLDLVNKQNDFQIREEYLKVGIWQGLSDLDPDVDAIYRLLDNTPCYFDKSKPNYVLHEGTLCPFNSQNTIFRKELFPLMYLPATVTFRFTDILRGLVAQPIMWLYGYYLGFTTATVVQNRNPHDYMKDFESEIPCYLQSKRIVELVKQAVNPNCSMAENLYLAYNVLVRENIVKQEEILILEAWIKDINAEK